MATLPQLDSFSEIADRSQEILAYVKEFPLKDHVYYFPNNLPDRRQMASEGEVIDGTGILKYGNVQNAVFAGSSALYYIQCRIDRNYTASSRRWEAHDADLFILNQPVENRLCTGIVDLVQTRDKTVEELLLNFDLGCCRAAFDPQMNLWISIQCMAAVFGHHYPLPNYMKNKKSFGYILMKHRHGEDYHNAEHFMFDRLQERIRKYSDRGFGVTWIETDEVIPWIKNRFHYSEWLRKMATNGHENKD